MVTVEKVGRSGADAPSGHSAEPEPCSTVSAVPASVPNANNDDIAFRLMVVSELAELVRATGDILADELSVLNHTTGVSGRALDALTDWDALSFNLRTTLRQYATEQVPA